MLLQRQKSAAELLTQIVRENDNLRSATTPETNIVQEDEEISSWANFNKRKSAIPPGTMHFKALIEL